VSLANCPECAGLLSDAADSSPHCGFPVKRPSDASSSVPVDKVAIDGVLPHQCDRLFYIGLRRFGYEALLVD